MTDQKVTVLFNNGHKYDDFFSQNHQIMLVIKTLPKVLFDYIQCWPLIYTSFIGVLGPAGLGTGVYTH